MNKGEANKLSSFEAVITVMDRNTGKYEQVPIVNETVGLLKNAVGDIKGGNLEFLGRTKGATENKINKENILTSLVFKIASALYVLGIKTKNPDLAASVKMNKTEFSSLRDPLLLNKSSQTIILAREEITNLTPYGITEETLTEAESALTDFQSAISDQTSEHSRMVSERELLRQKFYKVSKMLDDELDPLMELFEETEPEFYAEYKNARMIVDRGLRHEEDKAEA